MSHDFYKDRSGPVDLENCEREPIHIPGAVQQHGLLLVLKRADLTVVQASANAVTLSGRERLELDVPLAQFIGAEAASRLQADIGRARPGSLIWVEIAGVEYELNAHVHDAMIVLELEPTLPDPTDQVLPRASMNKIRDAVSLAQLLHTMADETRAITGFDRVMIYRFDADWNGEVVAEAKREDLGTFLGLHYPAADIPPQARRLYALNPIRLIPDATYDPVPLVPEINPITDAPLDLSHVGVRSVSPVHCEYLANMGVRASMSISLMVRGELWGLVACHHHSTRWVPGSVRTTCEMLATTMAAAIPHAQSRDLERVSAKVEAALLQLEADIAEGTPPAEAVVRHESVVRQAANADGLVVVTPTATETFGLAPGEVEIAKLVRLLRDRFGEDGVFETHEIRTTLPDLALGELAGLLAVELGSGERELLLLFRSEQRSTVTWGGSPNKQLSVVDGKPRLSPEGSFDLWQQTIEGKAIPWSPSMLAVFASLRQRVLVRLSKRSAELVRLNEQLRAATQAQDEFLATLSHELRNPLNAIVGWSRLLRDGNVPEERLQHSIGIIHRNAEVQLQLIEDLLDVSRIINGKMQVEPTVLDVQEPVSAAVDTVRTAADAKNIKIQTLSGSTARIRGDRDRLQQVFWNLLSNAVKFSPKGGRIRVFIGHEDSSVVVRVEDRGVGIAAEDLPHLFDRFQQVGAGKEGHSGLGLGLSIVRGIVELHGGTVVAESAGLGLGAAFAVRLPAASVDGAAETTDRKLVPEAAPPSLHRKRVLVVDDEPDAVELLQMILEEADADVTGVTTVLEAIDALSNDEFSVVVSDIGMPAGGGWAVAKHVRGMGAGKPRLVALTAYARGEDRVRAYRAGFEAHLTKPVNGPELVALLVSMLEAGS